MLGEQEMGTEGSLGRLVPAVEKEAGWDLDGQEDSGLPGVQPHGDS